LGVGGMRQDFEFQSGLLRLGVRYLTNGSDVGHILSAGRADVRQLRELKLGSRHKTGSWPILILLANSH
jgi:hypothetical protein